MSLKREDIFDAITDIDGEMIEEVQAAKRARTAKIIRFVGNAAAILVICIILFRGGFGRMGTNREMAKTEDVITSTAVSKAESVTESKYAAAGNSLNDEKTEEASVEMSSEELDALTMGTDENLLLASPVPEIPARPDDELRYSEEGSAEYDKAYQAWSDAISEFSTEAPDYDSSLNGFTGKLIKNFFAERSDDNRIISPSNVYLALAMLAETTDSNSRSQLLSALGVSDIETLREQALATWKYNFLDGGVATSILGASIWLDGKYTYNIETLKNLVDYYHASSYSGEMGSKELNESLHNWMNAQTGNFLKDQVDGIGLTSDMIAALVSTIYFKDSWVNSFNKNANTEMTFHGTKGDREVTFMNNSEKAMFYTGKNYTAVDWAMNEGYTMTFIKPEGKKTAQELLSNDEVLKFILSEDTAKKSRMPIVEMSVPKFDVQSQVELTNVLKAMGVQDVFTGNADFTPLTKDTSDISVSSVLHGARVKIDEEGCEAAAYTMITLGVTAAPVRDIEEFVLDKPFIYVIRNNMGVPLFVGVINNIE